jgi:hypothetical protein
MASMGSPRRRLNHSENRIRHHGAKTNLIPSNKNMKANALKIVGLAIALAAFGAVCIVGTHAQQTPASSSLLTTSWTGCLVVGKEDTMDNIARGPHPTTVREVEIGLRSDGVVVWRNALNTK